MHFVYFLALFLLRFWKSLQGSTEKFRETGQLTIRYYTRLLLSRCPGLSQDKDPPSSTLKSTRTPRARSLPSPKLEIYFIFIFSMGRMGHLSLMDSHTFKLGIS